MVQFSAAGYDSRVAGIDEVSARTVLAEMQERLASDPVTALGITSSASAEDARMAFLELTKRYHPVRFGRMAADIQKLSNEVFLALRAAHDSVAKNLSRRSGPIPTRLTGAAPSAPTAVPPAPSHPVAVPTAGRIVQPVPPKLARPSAAPSANDAGERPGSPGSPAPIPATPSSAKPGASGSPARPSAPAPAPAARAAAPLRPSGSAPAAPRDEAAVIDLLQRQQWDQARSALHQLSARDPSSKKIRALMCYARGREAQLSGLVDDARVELQDALDLDPELQLAKTALTELFTRRK
jgi:hypothetical protein